MYYYKHQIAPAFFILASEERVNDFYHSQRPSEDKTKDFNLLYFG